MQLLVAFIEKRLNPIARITTLTTFSLAALLNHCVRELLGIKILHSFGGYSPPQRGCSTVAWSVPFNLHEYGNLPKNRSRGDCASQRFLVTRNCS